MPVKVSETRVHTKKTRKAHTHRTHTDCRLRRSDSGRAVLGVRLLHAPDRHHAAVQLDVAHQLLPGRLSRGHQHGVRHEPAVPGVSGHSAADVLSLQESAHFPRRDADRRAAGSEREHRADGRRNARHARADGYGAVAAIEQAVDAGPVVGRLIFV